MLTSQIKKNSRSQLTFSISRNSNNKHQTKHQKGFFQKQIYRTAFPKYNKLLHTYRRIVRSSGGCFGAWELLRLLSR